MSVYSQGSRQSAATLELWVATAARLRHSTQRVPHNTMALPSKCEVQNFIQNHATGGGALIGIVQRTYRSAPFPTACDQKLFGF